MDNSLSASKDLGPTDYDEEDKSKRRRHSPVNTVPNDDEKDCMRAKIALEYYNKENGTNYEPAGAFLLSNDFISDGTWVHCNFAAWQPGKSPPRLFFAELHGDDFTTCNWTVMVCIVLEGNVTVGCSSCSEVIHPTHGFRQGNHKPKISLQPTTSSPALYLPTFYQPTKYPPIERTTYSPTLYPLSQFLPTPEQLKPYKDELSKRPVVPYPKLELMEPSMLRRKHAEDALASYNWKSGTNYEVGDTLLSKELLDGAWYHINFTAKPPNVDISPKRFFAEIYCGDIYSPSACFMLEEGKTTDACSLCSEVLHPTEGFRCRARKYGAETIVIPEFKPKLMSDVN